MKNCFVIGGCFSRKSVDIPQNYFLESILLVVSIT